MCDGRGGSVSIKFFAVLTASRPCHSRTDPAPACQENAILLAETSVVGCGVSRFECHSFPAGRAVRPFRAS